MNVRIVTDEADAVLSILGKERSGDTISGAEWQRLVNSEGYIRLQKREISMKRSFSDEDFRMFVSSDSLIRLFPGLTSTLASWRAADIAAIIRRISVYLPPEATIRAKIYPVIKPKTNSFVFEASTDPAIFIFLDPSASREQFENTLAHELHHIGFASWHPKLRTNDYQTISESRKTVLDWISAFGEGLAMLAAAGGPGVHPHAASKPEDRTRWDNDIKNFNADLRRVERFFLDVLGDRMKPEEIRETAFSFFGIQGPWYTVGWKMAATIETVYGRKKLIESFYDPTRLLAVYNDAAGEINRSRGDSLACWTPLLIGQLSGDPDRIQH